MKLKNISTASLVVAVSMATTGCYYIPENDIVTPETIASSSSSIAVSDVSFLKRLESPAAAGGNSVILVKYDPAGEYGINYAVEWDCGKRAQRWTAYCMHASNTITNVSRRNVDFMEDDAIPAQYRTTNDDYRNSGFDRGHMCPSADRLQSSEMNKQTFMYSNAQPQYHSFNSGLWNNMEEQVRKWNIDKFRDTLYVVKGGTIDNDDCILEYTESGMLIPKYFFMAVLCKNSESENGGYKALAFWCEHLNENLEKPTLSNYAISIDELEEKTGVDFFPNLADDIESTVEASVFVNSWGLK